MSKLSEMAVFFVLTAALTGSVAGLSLEQPRSEVLDNYTETSEIDVEQKLEEKVENTSTSEKTDIEEKIEDKMEEKTEEIKEEKAEKVTGKATEKSSTNLFSTLVNIFV